MSGRTICLSTARVYSRSVCLALIIVVLCLMFLCGSRFLACFAVRRRFADAKRCCRSGLLAGTRDETVGLIQCCAATSISDIPCFEVVLMMCARWTIGPSVRQCGKWWNQSRHSWRLRIRVEFRINGPVFLNRRYIHVHYMISFASAPLRQQLGLMPKTC